MAWVIPFTSGLVLGLGMILPIGPQNIFILSQSLTGGISRGVVAASTAGFCDSILIISGAVGLSRLLLGIPWLEEGLLWGGTVLLAFLGLAAFRETAREGHPDSVSPQLSEQPKRGGRASYLNVVLAGIGVSWGNPHAIFDTVAVLGAAIAAYPATERLAFAVGTVTASWLFFLFLVFAGTFLQRRSGPRTEVWVKRFSGVVLLLFAFRLGSEAWSKIN